MIIEILQHLDALHVELSAIDPERDCEAAQTVADIARTLQRLVAETPDPYSLGGSSAVSARNAA